MNEKAIELAHRATRQLHALERSVDTALKNGAALIACLAGGRLEAGLAVEVGQDALEALDCAMTQIIMAQGKVVEAHHALFAAAQEMNIPVAVGGGGGKPALPFRAGTSNAGLTVVDEPWFKSV
ncbi:hypothetical protein [Sphingomonas sp. ID0503]|uniref:hypothetical protein n=1 Tax=Sphingomonas sp. ID0503 TaxID=3399691 RepID=UPI003AFA57EB